MICCPPTIVPFSNAAITSFPYTVELQSKYGTEPRIEVFYYDAGTETFIQNNGMPGSQVKDDGVNVVIDHGGVQTGIVKIS